MSGPPKRLLIVFMLLPVLMIVFLLLYGKRDAYFPVPLAMNAINILALGGMACSRNTKW